MSSVGLLYGKNTTEGHCVCCPCNFTIEYYMNWGSVADLDIYLREDSADVVYFAHHTEGNLTLNHDAYPGCNTSDLPPEIISGTYTNIIKPITFYAWWNQYSNCRDGMGGTTSSRTLPSTQYVKITNNNMQNKMCITVAGTAHTINAGDDFSVNYPDIADAGFNTSTQVDFSDPTAILVHCDACPPE
jgi:hypothetical protein